MANELTPCTTHDWCEGHDPKVEAEPYEWHHKHFEPARDGESEVELVVSETAVDGVSFYFEIDSWTIAAADLDIEFASIRSILDQMEAQARDFLFKRQVALREDVMDSALTLIAGGRTGPRPRNDMRPVFIEPTGDDAA